ncbi:MAG: SusC/RagA family TonB-linked outer membrane protein, partial [Bacteroides sp.]
SAKTLVVSFVGMQKVEVAISPRMKVSLKPDSELLDEVMVVAFGTAKKSAFTGSAKVLGNEKLEQSQVSSVTNALAGAVPGVTLTSSNGAPGSTSSIQIRGFSSLNAGNDPLVIVDGAPYTGDISNLNPNDVESMTVLKDAASNALYGARGANGVIIITTKRAKSGDAQVSFDAKWGANSNALQRYNVIKNPAHYYEMHYDALARYYRSEKGMSAEAAWQAANSVLFSDQSNGGLGYNVYTIPEGEVLIGLDGKLNPNATLGRTVTYKGEDYYVTPDNWDEIGTRNGLRQEYNFSVTAANDRSSFYASLGYLDNQGITENSDHKRLTARLRADYQAKKWMKIGGNMSYARYEFNSLGNNGSSTSTGNIWAFTTQIAPIYPAYIRTADGKIKIDSNGFEMMDYGDATNAGMARPWISNANPILDNKLNTRNGEGNAFNGNGFINFNFVDGLTITLNGTYNLDETRYTTVLNPYYGQFTSTGGNVTKEHYRTYEYNLQQLINYQRSFGKHNAEIMLGHEYTDWRSYDLYASKTKMFSQSNKELDGAVVDSQNAGSSKGRINWEGYFGRLQYNYDEKYFASASLRRDASSKFHPDYRWGTFWSVGAAWLMNKENWFNVDWIQELKLKASYGIQGNDNIGTYRYTDVFNIVPSDGNVGTSFAAKGTKDISWETNGNFNIGAEFQLFKRISGSLEYYYRKTTDMLFSFSVAPSLGYSSYYDNIGDMYNAGLELDMNVNILNRKNLKWDVNFNVSTLKNRITKLHPDKKVASLYTASGEEYKGYNSGSFFIAEDVSIYTWRLKEYAGVDQETGLSMWYKNTKDESGKITGRETTTNYNDADYYVTEESTLPKAFGGFGTKVNAYGFDFAINFTYQLGGKQYDNTYARFMTSPTSSTSGYNFHADLLDSWTPENPSNSIPRFQWGDIYSTASSTRFLTSSSYLNLQNINFGYTLPAQLTKKLDISNVRIYLTAENVFYWSKRQGFDPRQSFSGGPNATTYAPMRTISGGISLKF